MDSLYLTWQFKITQIYRQGKNVYISLCGSSWKCTQWALIKITFAQCQFIIIYCQGEMWRKISCKRSYIHIWFFFSFFPNQLVKCNNPQVISKTKGNQSARKGECQKNCSWPLATWSALFPWKEKLKKLTFIQQTFAEHLQCARHCGKRCFLPLLSFQWHWTHV